MYLYAMISMMRVMSSPRIVASAIIETYLGPNETFRDVRAILDDGPPRTTRDSER